MGVVSKALKKVKIPKPKPVLHGRPLTKSQQRQSDILTGGKGHTPAIQVDMQADKDVRMSSSLSAREKTIEESGGGGGYRPENTPNIHIPKDKRTRKQKRYASDAPEVWI